MQPKVPQYQPPPDDPAYDALKAQAQQDQVTATQQRVEMDSASLMARYGTRLTMAAAGGASTSALPSPATPITAPPGGLNPVITGIANTVRVA